MVFWNPGANPEETQDVHQPSQTCGLGQVGPLNTESRKEKHGFAPNRPLPFFWFTYFRISVAVAG